jgi:EamA domain-containing membrane protein RarD
LRIEGLLALAIAIAACGLTVAMWLRQILPAVGIQV